MPGETVIYFNGKDTPLAVRLLIFQRAVQLYDAGTDDFLSAFAYKDLRYLSEDNSYVHFSLQQNDSRRLEVPRGHPLLHELLEHTGTKRNRRGVRERLKWPVLVAGSLALLVGIYLLLVSTISGFALQFISPQREAALGEMMFTNLVATEKTDDRATVLLNQFAAHLHLSEKYRLVFTVVNDTVVNAFAVPGGHIVVYKGILQKMQTPEELVALLGHESTHINERHSLRSMLRELTGGMMLSLVFGDLGSIGGAIAGRADMLQGLSYSRRLEEEADTQGMQRMTDNGIDPGGMAMLMDRLQTVEEGQRLPGFLSTHPLTTDRKAAALRFAAKHPVQQPLPPRLLAAGRR
ncbi:MAG: M48 family metallopeptidase [Flavihumibacter sp.]